MKTFPVILVLSTLLAACAPKAPSPASVGFIEKVQAEPETAMHVFNNGRANADLGYGM